MPAVNNIGEALGVSRCATLIRACRPSGEGDGLGNINPRDSIGAANPHEGGLIMADQPRPTSQVSIPNELLAHVVTAAPLIEAVLDAELSPDDVVAFLVERALTVLLVDLLGGEEQSTQSKVLAALAVRNPEVYQTLAEIWKAGELAIDREALKLLGYF